MKIARLSFAALPIVLCSLVNAQQAPDNASCLAKAKTQLEITRCSSTDFANADGELNRVYKTLMQKMRKDPKAAETLRSSQRAWLHYRDAQLKALHPHPEQEGSSSPACYASQATQLTRDRIATLHQMLSPQEGDVCGYRPSAE